MGLRAQRPFGAQAQDQAQLYKHQRQAPWSMESLAQEPSEAQAQEVEVARHLVRRCLSKT